MTRPVVAVDLGGTKIAAAVVCGTQLRGRVVLDTPSAAGPRAIIDAVASAVRQATDGARPAAVGVGSAGVIDEHGSVIASTDAITGWAGTALQALLTERFGVPVRVLNDVVAFLLGEVAAGAGRGARDALAVTVGTGIGGALLVNGAVVPGHRSVAGHVGHVAAAPASGQPCPCGRSGHVEAIAAGPAIVRRYNAISGDTLSDLRQVAQRASIGDAVAVEVIDCAARTLGTALGGLVNVLAPSVVVVGGGVALGIASFLPGLTAALRATLLPALDDVTVRPAALGASAGLVGAATAVADFAGATR